MTNPISRSQARSRTLGAQAACVLFVLAAAGIGVAGLPSPPSQAAVDLTATNTTNTGGLTGSSGINQGTNAQSPNGQGDLFAAAQVDTIGLAQRLAMLDNAPVINTKPVTQTPTGEDPEPEPVAADGLIARRVQYIGYISNPPTQHAFIRIDGKQRVVVSGGIAKSADESYPDLTIKSISPKSIQLSDGETSVAIALANRIGQSITMAGGEEVEVAAEKPNGSLLTEEDEKYLESLDPGLRPSSRRRLERERRGLPPRETRQPQRSNTFDMGGRRQQND
mgnify:CR=1 FL=1|tara:strand:- start:94563 stop:95399 length:837 start_codon:yes stop_codon:yes gene_type:complete